MVGLDMIGAGNKPGLDARAWRSGGCASEQVHIPGRDNFVIAALDEEKGARRNACHYVHRSDRVIVDAMKQAQRSRYTGDEHIRYFGIFFQERHEGGESAIRDHALDCW